MFAAQIILMQAKLLSLDLIAFPLKTKFTKYQLIFSAADMDIACFRSLMTEIDNINVNNKLAGIVVSLIHIKLMVWLRRKLLSKTKKFQK